MNKKLKLDGEFNKALPVLNKIVEAGFEAYFVGGSVRDRVLGLTVNDVDIATSAMPNEIKEIFKRTIDIGIEHGTVMVLENGESYEITTFRTESTYKDFRHPDSVTFVCSLTEDLMRRDFTMNAIAMDIKGNLIDPFGGLNDIDKRIIRAVGKPEERFQEDALRMMRAVRFAAQLDFEIEGNTLLSIHQNAQLLTNIAIERIQVEFEKLLTGEWYFVGLAAMIKTDLYLYCPKLADKKQALLTLIDRSTSFQNIRQAWAYLLLKIDEHQMDQSFNPRTFLKAWKLSNQLIKESITIYEALVIRLERGYLNEWEIFHLGIQFSLEVEDLMEQEGLKQEHLLVLERYDNLPIKEKEELSVSGNDLMKETTVRPGKWMSEALESALKAVIYRKIDNEKQTIILWLKENNFIPGLND